jgi:glutamine amidotransferase
LGVIDTGLCNLGSLTGALESLGCDPRPVSDSASVASCDSVILPGVGAFALGMRAISQLGLVSAVKDHVAAGKPLLGICLGMQLLFETGSEGETTTGLGILPGSVRRMAEAHGLPLPHVGWNDLDILRPHPLFRRLKPGVDFYFTHSYRADAPQGLVVATARYSEVFPAAVGRANVLGVQFHPEKSQKSGLRLLENFAEWDGRC